jgi:hypothetical protein
MYSASARMPNEIRVLLTVSASEGKADSNGYGRNSVGSVWKFLVISAVRSVFSVCVRNSAGA